MIVTMKNISAIIFLVLFFILAHTHTHEPTWDFDSNIFFDLFDFVNIKQ